MPLPLIHMPTAKPDGGKKCLFGNAGSNLPHNRFMTSTARPSGTVAVRIQTCRQPSPEASHNTGAGRFVRCAALLFGHQMFAIWQEKAIFAYI